MNWNSPQYNIYELSEARPLEPKIESAVETENEPLNEPPSVLPASVAPPVDALPITPVATTPSDQAVIDQARQAVLSKPYNLRIVASNMRIFLPLLGEDNLKEKIVLIERVAKRLWERLQHENRSTNHNAELKILTEVAVQVYQETGVLDADQLEALTYNWLDAMGESYFANNATVDFSEVDKFPELQIKTNLVAHTLKLSGQLTERQLQKVGRTALQWSWALMGTMSHAPASGRVPNPIFLTSCINAVTGVLKTELGDEPMSDEVFVEKLVSAKQKIHTLVDTALLGLAEEIGISSPRTEAPVKITSQSRFQKKP